MQIKAAIMGCVWVALTAALFAAPVTTVRVFNLHYVSVLEASQAVQPLLSEDGSLTLQPNRKRITVQDRPEVVARVAEVLEGLDRKPPIYRLRVELLQGQREALPAQQAAKVSERLKKMFPFVAYRQLGVTTFEGEIGQTAAAGLGGGYRVSFTADSLGVSNKTPWGIPNPGSRMILEDLVLELVGEKGKLEVLRTRVVISASQEVFIGAAASEDSGRGLVLILHALAVGEP